MSSSGFGAKKMFVESYMSRVKQRCKQRGGIRSLLDDKDAHTYSGDGYNSSSSANHHFISMRPVQTVEAQQDKQRGRDANSIVSRSIYIHPDPAHTSAGGLGQVERERQRSLFAAVC